MKYKCVQTFCLPDCDRDGFETGNSSWIESGTVWERDDKTNYIGGDVHLDDLENGAWLEIAVEDLKANFELIEPEETNQ